LLERHVRSFLQVKGAVNKGIRDTLRDEPDMFLAYNNGISVTAESIEVLRDDNGRPSIKKIRDMQIVNGGQTTASIYNAWKDRKLDVDFSKVFVQMKLSVIATSAAMDEIVPKISAFANTQNKIQMDMESSDLFSFDSGTDERDYGVGDMVRDILNGVSFGVFGLVDNFLSHSENVVKVENFINSISGDFDFKPYLDTAFARKETVIDFVKNTFITELIEPLQEQIKEIRDQKENKEKELQNTKKRRDELVASKAIISTQISSLAEFKLSFQ
jgi:hypothetical protein